MAPRAQPLTCKELAQKLGATVIGREDLLISGISDLSSATQEDLSFFHNEKYKSDLQKTHAGAVIATKADLTLPSITWIIDEQPTAAFQKAIEYFCPRPDVTPYRGIHPSAIIDPSAKIAPTATIAPLAIIGPRVVIGERSIIGPASVLSADVVIGADCLLHASVAIRENCQIGDRVILQPHVVIGGCGYGYSTQKGLHQKLEHYSHVIIGDDVEIGSGSCIDRGRFKPTRVGRGSKIDNLVMIAHGVEIGEDNLIVAQVGIAGSSKTGRWVVLGGQAGVAGHLKLDDGVQVAGQAAVTKNLSRGTYGGTPAKPLREWQEQQAHIRSIVKLKEEIKALKALVSSLSPPPSL